MTDKTTELVDHLFRHHQGKMVAILVRAFGLSNLGLIEDAVQDTFAKAVLAWRMHPPENPEAWLTQAAKHRCIDLLRKMKATGDRDQAWSQGSVAIAIDELFLPNEIADAQLRMVFTACHPLLDSRDQIAFALKTISGFSQKEIASALLMKVESVKKRLSRARKQIEQSAIEFRVPQGGDLQLRCQRTLEVIYLIFNEGFHSSGKSQIVREDLCAEAFRLVQLLNLNATVSSGQTLALEALICFQAARIPAKTDAEGKLIDLKNQDRGKWSRPLMARGSKCMEMAMNAEGKLTVYHFEAAIASVHLRAVSFEDTDWREMLDWLTQLEKLDNSPMHKLNRAAIYIQTKRLPEALALLQELEKVDFSQRNYLFDATLAECFAAMGQREKALSKLETALSLAHNQQEIDYLTSKQKSLKAS